jgi:hypothetical protein
VPDNRRVLDTLMHACGVDLFHSFDLVVAPLRLLGPERMRLGKLEGNELLGSIGFVGRGFSGTLMMAVPAPVFGLLKQDRERPFEARDWIREATNQMLGRIKARISQFQIDIGCGLPSTPGRDGIARLESRSATLLVYAFRTLRGQVWVALGGDLDLSLFVYSGSLAPHSEGDIILF